MYSYSSPFPCIIIMDSSNSLSNTLLQLWLRSPRNRKLIATRVYLLVHLFFKKMMLCFFLSLKLVWIAVFFFDFCCPISVESWKGPNTNPRWVPLDTPSLSTRETPVFLGRRPSLFATTTAAEEGSSANRVPCLRTDTPLKDVMLLAVGGERR